MSCKEWVTFLGILIVLAIADHFFPKIVVWILWGLAGYAIGAMMEALK